MVRKISLCPKIMSENTVCAAFADVFLNTDYDPSLVGEQACTDGCVYMR